MIRFSLLLAVILSMSCGPSHKASVQAYQNPALEAQYQTYLDLVPRGWVPNFDCDALEFVSLSQVGLADPGPVQSAMSAPGQWFRLPSLVADRSRCDSDISRDMFMGLFFWLWHFQQKDLAGEIWDYGAAHAWQMGQERAPPNDRTVMDPQQIGLLADLIYHLGGPDHPERDLIPSVYDTTPGYISHLTMLHILLYGSMHGEISGYQLDTLKTIQKTMDQDPLLQYLLHRYTDGDQTEATWVLLSTWPEDRLPEMQDWSEQWRPQRNDSDPGLGPNPTGDPTQQHTGGDFLFVASLILGKA